MANLQTSIIQKSSQKLSQKLSPQMILAQELMHLSTTDLCDKIHDTVDQNPALEIIQEANIDANMFRLLAKNNSSNNYSSKNDSDNFNAFIESRPDREESLQEYLMDQINCLVLSQKYKLIAEKLISNLDAKGFFVIPLEELLTKEELLVLPKVLKIIHNLEPSGVCCKNIQESLILQTLRIQKDRAVPFLVIPILKHLSNLDHPKPQKIKNKLQENPDFLDSQNKQFDLSDVEQALAFISKLNPNPAGQFANTQPVQYVVPDVIIRKSTEEEFLQSGDTFVVTFVKGNLPQIKIADDFKMLKGKNEFIDTHIREAKFFIDSIARRNQTLITLVNILLEYQQQFFLKGPKFLQPLRQKDIAKEMQVSETTISRIANNKYIQTEWGIKQISYFFSNAITSNNNQINRDTKLSGPSKESVKQEILAIIKNENKNLSDNQIMKILSSKGIIISRRTVNKYRKELNISSSYDR